MSIKNKIIIIFLIFTSISIVPFSTLVLIKLEKETLNHLITQNSINTSVFAKSVVNILFMNGGDVLASKVDVKDMIDMLEPLQQKGLVYADAILLSANPNLNGTILASIISNSNYKNYIKFKEKLPPDELDKMKSYSGSYREYSIENEYIEFISMGTIQNQQPICITRIVVKKSVALASIYEIKKYVNITSIFLMVTVLIMAIIFGMYLARPIIKLTEGAKEIEKGNYLHKVNIKNRDEIGQLASTFNNMALIIHQKITELENANIELVKMDRLKDEFLANTTHELKTPIHGITGLTQSMLDGISGELNDKARHLLTMILISGKRLSNLINDILDYSRLKNSDIILNRQSIDLGSMTNMVLTIISGSFSKKNLSLINNIEPGKHFVLADENRPQQIMINLIGNAVKFTHSGEIRINATVNNNDYVIEVKDTGEGIPQDKQQDIFDSFVQSDGSTTRKHSGTGLGLPITRNLIELHGGKIWLESKLGLGSSFFFNLPATGKAEEGYYSEIHSSSLEMKENIVTIDGLHKTYVPGEKSILIVDDDPINLQVLVNHLAIDDYNVESATTGMEALSLINADHNFDLLLLDVMMPEMSGFEVCKIVREKLSFYQLPIILLTAKNTNEDIITGLGLGANDYITKPFDKDQLLARVRNYVSLKKAVEEQNALLAIRQELDIAKNIQLSILPQVLPLMDKISIKAKYEPMSEIGGDFYDFHNIDDNKIGILIADVTGHGIPAALISTMIKIAFSTSSDKLQNPAALLQWINKALFHNLSERYITAFYTYINLDEMTITFSNAAHWPMYLIKENGKLIYLTVKGRLIGLLEDTEYNNATMPVESGDRLIFFTDGLLEERNSSNEAYGEKKLESLLIELRDLPPARVIDECFMDIYSYSGNYNTEGFEDDVTMIVVDIL
ncbi:MAG: SpoIIE family protein phosphatase [Spirochaetota bacterium]